MKKYLFGVLILICFVATGSFLRFDGWQSNGNFLVNGDLTATTFNNVKVYRALLTQTGTNAPTATILENTLGVVPTLARSSAGIYTATATGVFTSNKTWVLPVSIFNIGSTGWQYLQATKTSSNVITFTSREVTNMDGISPPEISINDDLLSNTEFLILVYP